MHDWRSTLDQVCDDMNAGLAIFRRDGLREVARNARWSELVDDEPERVRLLELIRRQLEYTGASAGSLREDYWELELSGRSYRLTTRCAPAGTLLPEAGVLVLMDRLGPELPTTRELRVSFGLRGREPQVALLAAEGLSNDGHRSAASAERPHRPPLSRAGTHPARSPLAQGAGVAPHGRRAREAAGRRRLCRRELAIKGRTGGRCPPERSEGASTTRLFRHLGCHHFSAPSLRSG